MTSKLTREQLHERARENVKALKMASRQTAFESAREEILADLQLAELALAAMDSEPVRNPVLAYADSYRDMAKQGVESVPIWSVITDLERNIAPLYRHAQQPVVPDDVLEALQKVARIRLDLNEFDGDRRGIADCLCDAEEALIEVVNRRAAMLSVAPKSPGSEPATVPGKWITVSERMPEKGQAVLVYRPKAHEGGDSDVRVAVYGRHNFEHGFGCYWEPTHWMPLPAAPQEVKGE